MKKHADVVPSLRIVNQPSATYRMRYKTVSRSPLLLAQDAFVGGYNCCSIDDESSSVSSSFVKKLRRKYGTVGSDSPGTASSIITPNDTIFPRIEIVNGHGPASLVVSCVNKCEPYHEHPHRLTGKVCKSGVAVYNIGKGERFFDLEGISIEFTKRQDIEKSLNERKNMNIDPYNVGFDFDHANVDLNQLRLCFQVFLRDSLDSKYLIRDKYHILKPIVSNIITNTSQSSSCGSGGVNSVGSSSRSACIQIVRALNLDSPAIGGKSVVVFMRKMDREQRPIVAKFYDDSGWSRSTIVHESSIHYQCALTFTAPAYKTIEIRESKIVFLKLFVAFHNEAERAEYIKNQKHSALADKNGEAEDAAAAAAFDELEADCPVDGKFESRVLEFVYTPIDAQASKKSLDTSYFFDFHDQSDRDALSELNREPRRKLAIRQAQLLAANDTLCGPFSTISRLMETSTVSLDALALSYCKRYETEIADALEPNKKDAYEDQSTILNRLRDEIDKLNLRSTTVEQHNTIDADEDDRLNKELATLADLSAKPNDEVSFDLLFQAGSLLIDCSEDN